jgi:hypothetical protein
MFLPWRKWMKLHPQPSRFGPRKPIRANICRPRVEPLENRFLPATFTVRTNLDSGVGSLRDAIMKVNLDPNPGTDIINFAIGFGVRTIALRSALPTITHPVIIDGTTQRGFSGTPLIELNGSGAGSAATGLTISAGGSTVIGLVINRFGQDGILLEGNGGDTIKGNYIGTDVSGTKAFGNGASGVEVSGGISNIIIGGTTAGARNLISGNGGDGITIFGSMCLVEGNYIGTDVTGTQALGNFNGISMRFPVSNTIGGAAAGAGNLISANRGAGIFAFFGANNIVQGNRIGTDVSGTRELGNAGGVSLAGETNDVIGGATHGAGNLISATDR